MDVPPVSHPAWENLVLGKTRYQLEFLATKFLLGYLVRQVEKDASPDMVKRCAQDLHDIFVRNSDLSSVQRDLTQIFAKEPIIGYLYDVIEVKAKIARGQKLLLAGDENLLTMLPAGDWVGGSIPYFMTEQGGLATRQKIYVTELPAAATQITIQEYGPSTLSSVYTDTPENGFSIIIIPGSSKTLFEFALRAPQYKNFAHRPLLGWIAGVHLDDLGKITPKVFNGQTRARLEDSAVVMHVTLPENQVAEIGYLNIFEQGQGDTITFPQDGFSVREAYVNGNKTNFAQYVTQKHLDTRLPLVADYFGATVNVSFQGVDIAQQEVQFYAPVFAGVSYKHAKPVKDYFAQFKAKLPPNLSENLVFSCNCILNYLYSDLEGKRTDHNITGPTTFGEVVYQLLNQTMAYLTITEIENNSTPD